jgi:hypothetical protein
MSRCEYRAARAIRDRLGRYETVLPEIGARYDSQTADIVAPAMEYPWAREKTQRAEVRCRSCHLSAPPAFFAAGQSFLAIGQYSSFLLLINAVDTLANCLTRHH